MDEKARMDLHGESNIICLIETKSGDEEVVMVETATMVNDEESQGSKNSYFYVIRAVSGR